MTIEGTCSQCNETCATCSDATTCDTCLEGYEVDVETGLCVIVPGGETPVCPANCESCSNETHCDVCEQWFFRIAYDNETAECVKECPTGYG